MKFDYLIIGAGFAGSVLAERIASQLDRTVLLVERRGHIGGNAYDYYDENGLMVQKYGPHIFHTNSQKVFNYLSQFTEWNDYVHRVLAAVRGKKVFLPINLTTMEVLYDQPFTPKSMRLFLKSRRIRTRRVVNSRDVILSQVGEELYELLFKNYTKKQWGLYPDELAPEVTERLRVRFNSDTRYFSDRYQGIPREGFRKMFERMLAHPNIRLILNTDYMSLCDSIRFDKLIFTGPIDSYFKYKYEKLPYRSLRFEFVTLDFELFQEVGVVNYPNDFGYTRITEFKHLYQQKHARTTICYEYPEYDGEPYYPIPRQESYQIYERYKRDSRSCKNVYFVGRLAEYKYLNMDQVVESSLRLFEQRIKPKETCR